MVTEIMPIIIDVEKENVNEKINNILMSVNSTSLDLSAFPSLTMESRNLFVTSTALNLDKSLADNAKEAKDIICVSSYLIEDGIFMDALLEASKRGVRVYLLTAREEELSVEKEDEFEDGTNKKEIIESHKKLLDKLAGKVLVRTSPHFHAKFALFDPKGSNPKGVFATCNFTKDAMSGKNIELALTMNDARDLQSFFTQFVEGFWNEAGHEMIRDDKTLHLISSSPFKEIDVQKITHPCTCKGKNTLRENLIRLIQSSQREIILSSWSFDKDHACMSEIKTAIQRGVHVKILCREKSFDSLMDLSLAGAELYNFSTRVHCKFIISDSVKSMIMTSNYSNLGLDSGFEVGILLNENETKQFKRLVENLISQRMGEFKSNIELQKIPAGNHKLIQFDPKIKIGFKEEPLQVEDRIEITNEKELDLSELRKIRDNDSNRDEFVKKSLPNDSKIKYKKIEGKITAIPKKFTDESVKVIDKKDGVVKVQSKNGQFFLVSNWDDYDKVIKFGTKIAYADQSFIDGIVQKQKDEDAKKENERNNQKKQK
ncbi:Cardiolipin synthase [Methanosarcinaceae archaeon Ag5]|uniref:Cardiolipin synthase n=1 Tax=Methanolapillus africanus TaxID=3028297 RepID=A0AAE4SD54_9EURY|nr:Cardiolipin synthase [Methanosarcinaceae archaeon Ag5]